MHVISVVFTKGHGRPPSRIDKVPTGASRRYHGQPSSDSQSICRKILSISPPAGPSASPEARITGPFAAEQLPRRDPSDGDSIDPKLLRHLRFHARALHPDAMSAAAVSSGPRLMLRHAQRFIGATPCLEPGRRAASEPSGERAPADQPPSCRDAPRLKIRVTKRSRAESTPS